MVIRAGPWWVRPGLDVEAGRLRIAGHDAKALAREHGDVFAEDYPMPPVAEGDMVAILNAGGYLQAMSSTHCLRPMGGAVFLGR